MVKLGQTVRDTITGFEGILVCRAEWLHGCVRCSVQPRALHEGKPVEMQTFDEPQLVVVEDTPQKAQPPSGGPRPEPTRNAAPRRA